ncbi:hypothetical protein BKA70DRAFT_1030231, partial [Coprinopsis sp. MPI-PUGE-AT-0042]
PLEIPVAFLRLRSFNNAAIAFFARFASHTATSLGIPTSKPLHLPTQQSISAALCNPLVDEQCPERPQDRMYKRYKPWDASFGDVNPRRQCMNRHLLAKGVGMRVTKWER